MTGAYTMFGSSGSTRPLESIAAADADPVAGADARAVQRPRGTADRSVVLGAAADVVERPRVVGRDAIELRERQVREVPERLQPSHDSYKPPSLPIDVVLRIGGSNTISW